MNKLEIKLSSLTDDFREGNSSENNFQSTIRFIVVKKSIWVFNKYDKDNWPSKPHGHNKEKPEKIDVYTGNIYDSRNRQYVGKLRTKYLIEMQNELKKKGFFTKEQLGKTLI